MPDQHAAFFKCFSTWSRNRILELLAQHGELSVEELSHQLGLKEPTVSRHLQLLKLHGVVQLRPESPVHYYSLNGIAIVSRFRQFLDYLGIEASTYAPAEAPESAPGLGTPQV